MNDEKKYKELLDNKVLAAVQTLVDYCEIKDEIANDNGTPCNGCALKNVCDHFKTCPSEWYVY